MATDYDYAIWFQGIASHPAGLPITSFTFEPQFHVGGGSGGLGKANLKSINLTVLDAGSAYPALLRATHGAQPLGRARINRFVPHGKMQAVIDLENVIATAINLPSKSSGIFGEFTMSLNFTKITYLAAQPVR